MLLGGWAKVDPQFMKILENIQALTHQQHTVYYVGVILKEILRKKKNQTVFTLSELASLLAVPADNSLINYISYYRKKGEIKRLSKGIYALDSNYSKYEFGNKLRSPSYISFYSVLSEKGLVFQPYTSIFFASNRSEIIEINNQKYIYRKLKEDILLNPLGINYTENYSVATVERALLDLIYLNKNEYIDNLRDINWEFAKELNKKVYKSTLVNKYILENANNVGSS